MVDRSGRLELLGALNPALRVPTLVLDDGEPLAESNAILCYLAEGTRCSPRTACSGPASCSGCSSSSTATSPTSPWCASGSASRPIPAGAGGDRGAPPRAAMPRSTRWSAIWPSASFLVGERFTIADIALYAYTHVAHEAGFEMDALRGDRRMAASASPRSPGTSRSRPDSAADPRHPARGRAARGRVWTFRVRVARVQRHERVAAQEGTRIAVRSHRAAQTGPEPAATSMLCSHAPLRGARPVRYTPSRSVGEAPVPAPSPSQHRRRRARTQPPGSRPGHPSCART